MNKKNSIGRPRVKLNLSSFKGLDSKYIPYVPTPVPSKVEADLHKMKLMMEAKMANMSWFDQVLFFNQNI